MSQGPLVLSIGNMLVEVMREGIDQALDAPGPLLGPYPSGDTPIYIDAVGRLGHRAAFIGAVGDDDFGRCLTTRLARDGVDLAGVHVLPDHTTGVAFVAYFGDGSRRFVYHWRHAAAGQLAPSHVAPELVARASWLHLTGCNLAVCDSARNACLCALAQLRPGATVSFDPNIRPEVLTLEEVRALCSPVIERADVICPSLGEAAMLAGCRDDEDACRVWARAGKLVALKCGERGCRLYRGDERIDVPAFAVSEVDPTGAGDCFCGALTVALLEGLPLAAAGRFANAAGALAVTVRGPMEGNPLRADLERWLAART